MKQRYDVIAKAYDAAMSPEEYDALVHLWNEYLSALDDQLPFKISGQPALSDVIFDDEISHHFARAALILQKMSGDNISGNPADLIDGDDRSALVLGPDGRVEASNSDPGDIFHSITHITELETKLRAGDYARLRETISRGEKIGANVSPTVILCEGNDGQLSHFVVVPAKLANPTRFYFILRSLQPRWSEELKSVLRNVFELTKRECEIIEGWCNSLSISDLAKRHNRSVQTVRTQVKTVLAKTGTSSQTALMRLVSGLSSLFAVNSNPNNENIAIGQSDIIKLPAGRRIEIHLHGPENGRPVVFIHGMLGGMIISPEMSANLFKHNVRLIVPIRPSFGRSDPFKNRETAPEQFANDMIFVLDFLQAQTATFVGYGAGALYAFATNTLFPQRVAAIINFAGGIPVTSRRQILAMKPRQCVMALTARYTPSLLPMLVDGGISQIRGGLEQKFIDAMYKETSTDMQIAHRADVLPLLKQGLQMTVEQGANAFVTDAAHVTRDWSDLVKNTQNPVALYHGEHDPVVPIETVRAFSAKWDHIKLYEFADAGQLLLYKKPNLFFEAFEKLQFHHS